MKSYSCTDVNNDHNDTCPTKCGQSMYNIRTIYRVFGSRTAVTLVTYTIVGERETVFPSSLRGSVPPNFCQNQKYLIRLYTLFFSDRYIIILFTHAYHEVSTAFKFHLNKIYYLQSLYSFSEMKKKNAI